MSADKPSTISAAVWMVICCLLPIIAIYVLTGMGFMISPLVLLLLLVLCWLAMAGHLAQASHGHDHNSARQLQAQEVASGEQSARLLADLRGVMDQAHLRQVGSVVVVDGRLLLPPQEALEAIAGQLRGRGLTPVLQDGDFHEARLLLLPGPLEDDRPEGGPWLNLLLFAATIATTTWAGALHQGVDVIQEPSRFLVGLPYSLALMLILGAHELGHYFAARAHGVRVTLPYFIPVPFALGTFGAFIRMKSLPPHRRALFDVAVAGPLAGLVFAIPALWLGLGRSQVVADAAAPMMHHGTEVGSSILLAVVAKAAMGDAIVQGHQLMLHPLAFAGWLGLIVTALNLLPIGQLDGGHIADSLFGVRRSATISTVAMFSLLFLGLFVWSGLLMWALIAFFLAGSKGIASRNDLVPLGFSRFALGVVAFVILFLILSPVPHAFYRSMGIHCPYL